jgi:uncharacterized protein YeaO (DUF488 family)
MPITPRPSRSVTPSPVAIRIVRLGTPRAHDEGVRIGTVRRPPRGVPRTEFARADFYDVWLPDLAPSEPLLKAGRGATTEAEWQRFRRRYRAEMNQPAPRRMLDLLAALSHAASFSVGCYCEAEQRCHRSVLRELLIERAAALA